MAPTQNRSIGQVSDTPKTPRKLGKSNVNKNKNPKSPAAPKKRPSKKRTPKKSSEKKRPAKGWFRTTENNELVMARGDSSDEEEKAIDYYPDDSDDSDYIDDSDAEIVDSMAEGKCDYGDLEEEGGRYVLLLKKGTYVKEEEHEAQDPEHKTCVLDVKEDHVVKQQ